MVLGRQKDYQARLNQTLKLDSNWQDRMDSISRAVGFVVTRNLESDVQKYC